jgi:hypothetical protein
VAGGERAGPPSGGRGVAPRRRRGETACQRVGRLRRPALLGADTARRERPALAPARDRDGPRAPGPRARRSSLPSTTTTSFAPEALSCITRALERRPDADPPYRDEDTLLPDSRRTDAYFKPFFSPGLLLL